MEDYVVDWWKQVLWDVAMTAVGFFHSLSHDVKELYWPLKKALLFQLSEFW
jgi:hypothetical protein